MMETEENSSPLTLPDTQNADSQAFTQSQDTLTPTESEPKIWGRLYPHNKDLLPVVLTKDVYTFGRFQDCDICVKGKMGKKESVISKVHFQISRERCFLSSGMEDEVIYLIDLSQNGTFVNSNLIGKGNRTILVNNDLIAVAINNFNVFVYMSTTGYDDSFLPEHLRIKYAVSRTLGAGACGEVKLCFSKVGTAGKKYAMKIIPKSRINETNNKNCLNDEKQTLNEVEICKRLKHPCVIKIEEYYESPSAVYIILELMEGGELFERIKKFNGLPEKNAKFIFYQVALAVNYLHRNGITHRDLKPENILLAGQEDETIVKVSDFGLSKFVDSETMMKTFCGTPMYVAPEILKTGGRGTYTNQVDVWSLGVILYCCLTGLTPFKVHDKINSINLYEQIINGMYSFNIPKFYGISSNAKDLIRRMMTVDPTKRITIEKVLTHQWLNDHDMLTKVHGLLGLTNTENILPKKQTFDNIPTNPEKYKRPRLE